MGGRPLGKLVLRIYDFLLIISLIIVYFYHVIAWAGHDTNNCRTLTIYVRI